MVRNAGCVPAPPILSKMHRVVTCVGSQASQNAFFNETPKRQRWRSESPNLEAKF